MALQDTKKREKALAIAAGSVVAGVLLFTMIVDPQLQKHKVLAAQLAQFQLDLTRARGNLRAKDRIDKAYTQIEPLIVASGNRQQQISDFTRLLDQMYSRSDVKIRSVKILPVTDENYYQKLAIRIEMTVPVRQFLEFIQAVEQHSEPIRIEQLNMTAQETTDTITASMIISKVVAGDSQSAGKI